MSYRIEYDWAVVRLPKERIAGAFEDHYLLAVLAGDNNVYCAGTNQRSRDWHCVAFGDRGHVMETVVSRAAACETGMLKPRGRNAKAEHYISAIRKMVDDAQSLQEAANIGFRFDLKLNVPADHPEAATIRSRLAGWGNHGNPSALRANGVETQAHEFSLDLDAESDLTDFVQHTNLVNEPWWAKITVYGPGET